MLRSMIALPDTGCSPLPDGTGLRRADARFLLPDVAGRRACVLTTAEGWTTALRLDGWDVGAAAPDADLVVVGPHHPLDLRALHDRAVVVVEGREPRAAGVVRPSLVRHHPPRPAGRLRADRQPLLVRHAVGHWHAARRPSRLARRVLRAVPRIAGPVLPSVTVLARSVPEPAAFAIARGLAPRLAHGYLLTGGGSERRRAAALLFEADQEKPRAVLKLNRYPGGEDRVRAEARALDSLRASSTDEVLVPQRLGSGEVSGRAFSLETAGRGRLLSLVADEDPAAARACLARLRGGWTTSLSEARSARAAEASAPGWSAGCRSSSHTCLVRSGTWRRP
jgi:hypothetical protein